MSGEMCAKEDLQETMEMPLGVGRNNCGRLWDFLAKQRTELPVVTILHESCCSPFIIHRRSSFFATKESLLDSDVCFQPTLMPMSFGTVYKGYYGNDGEIFKPKEKDSLSDLLAAMETAIQNLEKVAIMEKLLFLKEPERVIFTPTRWEIRGKQRQPWRHSRASPQDDGERLFKYATPITRENQSANYENKNGVKKIINYENKNVEIEEMLLSAGALRARDLPKQNGIADWVLGLDCDWNWHKPSSNAYITDAIVSPKRELASCGLLLMAALLAAVTYRAAFTPPAATLQTQVYAYYHGENGMLKLGKQDSTITHSFIFFNSTVFFGSLSIMIFLLHDFPLKPWPQITVSTLIGSYMCAIMATSPTLALALFILATPFLVFAAAAKFHGFPMVTSRYKP